MIRIAILEYEKETKDIVFALARMLDREDWVFRHYWKASQLAKAMKQETFQVFIFDEMFKSPRLESVFIHDNPNALFFYICEDPRKTGEGDQRDRIFYLDKSRIQEDLEEKAPVFLSMVKQSELYSLVYDGVHVNLPYQDILYLEKMDKMVYFHTKKGLFHKRMNMSELESLFEPYGFLRVHVSYLVNRKHITAWNKETVELDTKEKIPVSRAQKRRLKPVLSK